MKHHQWVWWIVILFLTACETTQAPQPPVPQLKTVTIDQTKFATAQTVYVPVYSHIYMIEPGRKMDLTATLSIRNTDLSQPIIVTAANYYDTNGKIVRKYLEQPIELGSLAATEFVIAQEDVSGGAGAAFVVEWGARKKTSAPVIEAVMINTAGNQGVSFISPGRVIKSRENRQ